MRREDLPTPESGLEIADKHILWEKQIALLDRIEGWPPIDGNIKETIAALNINGIPTLASCGGHMLQERHTGDTPYPWVLISSQNREGENLSHGALQSLLVEFYKGRQTEDDIRLEVSGDNHGQISLASAINEDLLERLAEGKLTQKEKEGFIEKLPHRQKEMEDFGQFLKSRFFAADPQI